MSCSQTVGQRNVVGLAFAALRALRDGRTADFAVLKAAAAGAPPTATTRARLVTVAAVQPSVAADDLDAAPPGSLGAALRDFLSRHGFEAITLSDAVRRQLPPDSTLAVRYVVLHDLFHVVLGFDASYAGELGVWHFVAGQNYSQRYRSAAKAAGLIYPLRVPHKRAALSAARARGDALAAQLNAANICLVAEPLDQWLHESLEVVRQRVGLVTER